MKDNLSIRSLGVKGYIFLKLISRLTTFHDMLMLSNVVDPLIKLNIFVELK